MNYQKIASLLRNLADEIENTKEDATIETNIFDHNGRFIPQGVKSAVYESNKKFYLKQPDIDFTLRFDAIKKLNVKPLTSSSFKKQSTSLIEKLQANPNTRNLLNGVCLPIVLPKLDIKDYGATIEDLLLSVEKSYKAEYPSRTFINYRKNELQGKVSIIDPSHEALIEKLREAPQVGLYLPTALQGFSVLAQREQVLPEGFSLCGLEIIIAQIMYPDILARDFYTPGFDLAALQWQGARSSLYFEALDAWLEFDRRFLDARGAYSGGLFVLGSGI